MNEPGPERQAVAALVVTFNRKELLQECIAAIVAQDYPVARIIVIDNASTDGTADLFNEGGLLAANPIIEYRLMQENLGGAGGFKEGLRIANLCKVDWVWLMDDDCIPYPSTLTELVKAADTLRAKQIDPSFLASAVYGPANEPMNVPALDCRSSANGYADWYTELDSGMAKIESATFVSLLINNSAITQVGLPISSFFIWGDDTEYTTRLTHHYGPAFLVGQSRVLHKRMNAKSLSIMNEDNPKRIANYHYLYRNNLIVQRYHHGKGQATKLLLRDLREAFKCMTSGGGGSLARNARARAILAGICEYVTKQYEIEDLGRFL